MADLILIISGLYFLFYFILTRGITYQSIDTDNQKQAEAAAAWRKWGWPSGMHAFGKGKTAMKDAMVILLSCFQMILFDKKTDRPLIALCFFSNALSGYLIYLVGSILFDQNIAVLLSLLFFTAIWPTQVAFFGGHVCIGQMFFILGVYLCLSSNNSIADSVWYVAAGASFVASQFSSSSSRKYIPFILSAFVFSLRGEFEIAQFKWDDFDIVSYKGLFISSVILTLVYFSDTENTLFLNRIKSKVSAFQLILLFLILYFSLALVKEATLFFYISHLALLSGGFLTFAFFTLPNVRQSIKEYFNYFHIPKTTCRFRLYLDFFKRIGKPIPEDFRGEGWPWIGRMLLRFIPLHTAFAIVVILFAIIGVFYAGERQFSFLDITLCLILAVTPAFWGEVTKGPQISRSYLPMFIGVLLLIGVGLSQTLYLHKVGNYVYLITVLIVVSSFIHSIKEILEDVYPSRMVCNLVGRRLKQLGAKEYYTYDHPCNEALTGCPEGVLSKDFKINHISSLLEVNSGYVVVPCISSKAFHLESMPWSVEYGDFTLDHNLSLLIDSRKIEELSVGKFVTYGNSNYWIHESEVTSYRLNVIGDIKPKDRFRSYAWILDGKKVGEYFASRHTKWGVESKDGSKVAIIVPTMNRSDFAIRTIKYFEDVNFKGALYISDSSSIDHFERTKSQVEASRGAIEVYHLDCRKLNFSESVDAALMMVDRPYVAYLGDDDYFIPQGLDEAATFLDKHRDYSAAHGEAVCFTLDRDGTHGNIASMAHYPQPILEQEHPLERVFTHLCSYMVTIFSVHKTETFHLMTRDVFDIPERIFRDELTACCLSTVFGKVKGLEGLYLIRQSHDQRYVCPTQFAWVSNLNWGLSFNYFLHAISREIAVQANAKVSEVHESVKNALSIYLSRSISVETLKTSISLPSDIPAKPWTKEMFILPTSEFYGRFAPVLKSLGHGSH